MCVFQKVHVSINTWTSYSGSMSWWQRSKTVPSPLEQQRKAESRLWGGRERGVRRWGRRGRRRRREGVGLRFKGKSATNESTHTSLPVGVSIQNCVYKDLYQSICVKRGPSPVDTGSVCSSPELCNEVSCLCAVNMYQSTLESSGRDVHTHTHSSSWM